MVEPQDILEAIEKIASKIKGGRQPRRHKATEEQTSLKIQHLGAFVARTVKMRILITAGATREYIDPVRFISNASSGKMGYALVRAALKAGHKVTLITTVENSKLKTQNSKLLKVVQVETAARDVRCSKETFRTCDCLIMAAAVADYTPAHPAKTKIKKDSRPLTIKLKPTPDILKWAGKHKNESRVTSHGSRIIVGFALEDKNCGKMPKRNCERRISI